MDSFENLVLRIFTVLRDVPDVPVPVAARVLRLLATSNVERPGIFGISSEMEEGPGISLEWKDGVNAVFTYEHEEVPAMQSAKPSAPPTLWGFKIGDRVEYREQCYGDEWGWAPGTVWGIQTQRTADRTIHVLLVVMDGSTEAADIYGPDEVRHRVEATDQ